jgi:hypothetical protein
MTRKPARAARATATAPSPADRGPLPDAGDAADPPTSGEAVARSETGRGDASWTTVIDYEHWERPTWQMAFGRMVRNARATGRLIEGRDDDGAWMALCDTPWELAVGQQGQIITDQRDEWRALWTIGCIKGWLNDAIDALVPAEVAE